MKIRKGFVSNSSSSSFVVTIPENFKVPEDDLASFNKYEDEDDQLTMEDAQEIVDKFIKEGYVDNSEEYQSYGFISELYYNSLHDHRIAEIEGSGDSWSTIKLLTKEDLKKHLEKL